MKLSKLLTLPSCARPYPCTRRSRLPKLISDHMVLQRDQPLQIWAGASPKEKITLQFDQKTYKTSADAGGKWAIALPAHKAGTGYAMVLKGKTKSA